MHGQSHTRGNMQLFLLPGSGVPSSGQPQDVSTMCMVIATWSVLYSQRTRLSRKQQQPLLSFLHSSSCKILNYITTFLCFSSLVSLYIHYQYWYLSFHFPETLKVRCCNTTFVADCNFNIVVIVAYLPFLFFLLVLLLLKLTVDIVLFGFFFSSFPLRFWSASTSERFSHPYKQCFVPLLNWRKISQSILILDQRPRWHTARYFLWYNLL